jgi:gluconate 2-dehydrogenase gamma chain
MDRRRFLKSAAGGTVVLAYLPTLGLPAEKSVASGCKFFTVAQATAVAAIVQQIVPPDEHPGAKESGVVFYIDGILSGRFGYFYRDRYAQGLKLVDGASHKQFVRNFSSLEDTQQIAILRELESGQAAGSEGRKFFALIRQHTIEGYYGDPEHGGNHEGASWEMIGFEG